MTAPVVKDSLTLARHCAEQKQRAEQLRSIVKIPQRKRQKAISASDVGAAINAALDDLDREFRRLGAEFPKFRQAYGTARVSVANVRPDARGVARLLARVERSKEDELIAANLRSKSRASEGAVA